MLDHRARGQARATAEQLLTLRATDVAVLQPDGTTGGAAQEQVAPGDRVLVGIGRADRRRRRGGTRAAPLLDASLVTGESLPVPPCPARRCLPAR